MTRQLVVAALAIAGAGYLSIGEPLNASTASTSTVNNCLAADPTDYVDDRKNLQDCLDLGGTIELLSGSPGYILEEWGLRIHYDNTILTSADTQNRATILAGPGLKEFMIRANANDWRITHINFDGNRFLRPTSGCTYPNGQNIMGYGDGFVVSFVDSSFARCGSALEVSGSNFEIYNNTLAYNGWSEDESIGQWADGITVHRCDGGYVHSNQMAENTDVGLVVNEGQGCSVRWNTIWNFNRYAFGGMHISAGDFGDHSGSLFSDNDISSGYDLMGIGLTVGAEQWHHSQRTADVGTVGWNTIDGAVINLMVDGVDGGTVVGNSMSNAQGTRGLGTCLGLSALNFASHHNTSVSLQSGSTTRTCH